MTEGKPNPTDGRRSRWYWFAGGLACGTFILGPFGLFAFWIIVSATEGRATWHNQRTTLATAIREATALVGGTPRGDSLPPAREDTVLLEVLNEDGNRWNPPTYILWPPMKMMVATNQQAVWLIQLREDIEPGWWETDTISQFNFFDNAYPTPDLETRSIRIPHREQDFIRWWSPKARGNTQYWFIPNHGPNVWPHE